MLVHTPGSFHGIWEKGNNQMNKFYASLMLSGAMAVGAMLPTCTTTTKTLTFHPNTSRALSWSVETETSTEDGNC